MHLQVLLIWRVQRRRGPAAGHRSGWARRAAVPKVRVATFATFGVGCQQRLAHAAGA